MRGAKEGAHDLWWPVRACGANPEGDHVPDFEEFVPRADLRKALTSHFEVFDRPYEGTRAGTLKRWQKTRLTCTNDLPR